MLDIRTEVAILYKGVHVSALTSAPVSRKLLVIPVVGLAAAAVFAATQLGQQAASGAGEEKTSAEFTLHGDGSLPTKKPALGADRAPLSADETGYAIHLASTDSSIPASATNVRGEPGVEFLYADIPDDIDTPGRKAVVNVYDYHADVGHQLVVDLAAGKVVSAKSADDLQPPTSTDEADVAMEIAIAQAAEDFAFKTEFEAAQGVPLVTTDQVEYVAGTFVFDGTTAKGKECGVDRCAQLMVQTASGTFLNTWDFVVNLSDQSIVKFN